MMVNGDYRGLFKAGTKVKISAGCPFQATFPQKVGEVKEIIRDQIGLIWLVGLRSGEEVYLRRAELALLYEENPKYFPFPGSGSSRSRFDHDHNNRDMDLN